MICAIRLICLAKSARRTLAAIAAPDGGFYRHVATTRAPAGRRIDRFALATPRSTGSILFGGQPGRLLLGGHLGAEAHRVVEGHLFARVAIFALALSATKQRG